MINQERILAEFVELVKIKSSTRAERQIANLLKSNLEHLGLSVKEDNAGKKIGGNCGNIFGYLKGTQPNAPRLLLNAHMDCVEPCENVIPVIKDGIISSAGNTILGADDKAGIVPILEALRVINENNLPHGDIQVVFSIAEEGGVNGAKNMDSEFLQADFGYVLDSSGAPGKIINKAPGQNRLDIIIHGKKAHAGLAPEKGISAIAIAGKALYALKQGRLDPESTSNVGTIHGGIATNIVPDQVIMQCEVRSRNAEKLDKYTAETIATFRQIAEENLGHAEITINNAYMPFNVEEESTVVQTAKVAARNIGITPVVEPSGGGFDANFYNLYGIPSVSLSVGMMNAHTTEEYIKVEDLYKTSMLIVEIIKTVSNQSK